MKKAADVIIKIALSILALIISYVAVIYIMFLMLAGLNRIVGYVGMAVLPSLLLPVIWLKRRKRFLHIWYLCALAYIVVLGVNIAVVRLG